MFRFKSRKECFLCYSAQILSLYLLFFTIIYVECANIHPGQVNSHLLQQLKEMNEYKRNSHLLSLVQKENVTITQEVLVTIATEKEFTTGLLEAFIEDLAKAPTSEFEAKLPSLQLLFDLQPDLVDAKLDMFQQTPLHLVAKLDFLSGMRIKLLRMLIQNGASVNRGNYVGLTAVSWAVAKIPTPPDLMDVVKLLIENGANPNERYGLFELTFVHLVAERHSSKVLDETVQYLQSINNTRSLTIDDRFGGLVVHYALKYGKYEISDETLEIFNSSGTNFNAINEMDDDGIVLKTGIKYGKSARVLKSLIRFGAQWRNRKWKGDTPLHIAVKYGNLPALKLLIGLGADLNANVDSSGFYVLARAILNGTSEEFINTLIKAGANWNKVIDDWNITAAHVAASSHNLGALKVLISNGVDVNAKEEFDWNTPLHAVFMKMNDDETDSCWSDEDAYQLISKLVEAGADVNERNKYGYLAIDFARNFTFPEGQLKSNIFKLLEPPSLPITNFVSFINLDNLFALCYSVFVAMER